MCYTLCWYDPQQGFSYELDYGTLAEAQLHLDYLLTLPMMDQSRAYIRCEELN